MLSVGVLVADVEPLVPPPLDGRHELDIKVCDGGIDMYPAVSYVVDYGTRCLLTLKLEKPLEETKVRLDPEPALAKRDIARNVKKRIWGQLVQLEPLEAKKAPDKRMQG